MPLSVEWISQNTYMHNSFDHLLPEDKNQDFLIIKQEAEFFQSTLNSQQSAQNKIMHLQVLSKENKESKQQNSYLDPTVSFNFTLSSK